MEVEVFKELDRNFTDLLFSDQEKCSKAMTILKNAVIGSNRQKGAVIMQGIVPRLITLICDEKSPLQLRLDAAIIICSLAKGTEQHVSSLIYYGIVDLFLAIAIGRNTPECLLEVCLNTLKTILQYPFAPYELIHQNVDNISRLIDIATQTNSHRIQSYITHILIPLDSTEEQLNLYHAGVLPFLAKLVVSGEQVLQIPALRCLSSICFSNKMISDVVCNISHDGRLMPDILSDMLSRTQSVQIQLSASRCLTYLHRSGSLSSTDHRIVYKVMPCLARLCTPEFDDTTRASAAETLAYLTEIDIDLQRLASISNHLIPSLVSLLKTSTAEAKQGAFRCIASLTSNAEEIRKRIIEMDGLMQEVINSMKSPKPQLLDEDELFFEQVRLAAVRCLHSLSRSVQLLRTTFQDHLVWCPLMELLNSEPSSPELLAVCTSTVCNLLLEFSPAKAPMLESGAVEMLCKLTQNPDPSLRLNGSWALMNMAFQAEQNVKTKIMDCLGTDNVLRLLNDPDTKVIMKTLGLLRNLLSHSQHIEVIMNDHSTEIMKAIYQVLDANHPALIKEQALCIVGNIAAGSGNKEYVLDDDNIMAKLSESLDVPGTDIKGAALFVIGILLNKKDSYNRLKNFDIIGKLEHLQDCFPTSDQQLYEDIKQTLSKFKTSSD